MDLGILLIYVSMVASLDFLMIGLVISLCNFVYKVISKIISNKVKNILFPYICRERFGFLPGR